MDSVSDEPNIMLDWRNKTKDYFSLHDVRVYNPTDRPHSSVSSLTDKEIFELDMVDVRNSDIILFDARNHGKPQFGSPVEVFYANYILHKPVIGWYDERGYRENSIFQNVLVSNMFPSLEEALEHIEEFYLGSR